MYSSLGNPEPGTDTAQKVSKPTRVAPEQPSKTSEAGKYLRDNYPSPPDNKGRNFLGPISMKNFAEGDHPYALNEHKYSSGKKQYRHSDG